MKIKIEISKGSGEQQMADIEGCFVEDLIEFCEKNTNSFGLKLGIDEGFIMFDSPRVLIFSNEKGAFDKLQNLQNKRNKLNREISTLKKANLKAQE